MLNNQQIQNNWPTIKSHVLSKWNKLSESEVERTHGDTNTLGKLVRTKYGNNEEFDRAYDQICKVSVHSSRNTSVVAEKKFSSRQADGVPDFENRSKTAPSAEAGMYENYNEFHTGSPEQRSSASYNKFEHTDEYMNREADDELSHYMPTTNADLNQLNNTEPYTHFSAPDEFYPSQDPSSSSEDIPLGRINSSATKISTAKAAPISSAASNDAKKKI